MTESEIIERTKSFVEEQLKNAESGHDYSHITRVLNLAIDIAKTEEKASNFIV